MSVRLKQAWNEYKAFAIFIVLMVIFRSAVADWNDVPSGSMLPTIVEGDRILVDKLAYDVRVPLTHVTLARLGEPERGDIVVFDSKAAGTRLVKRVIGVPGDVIAMRDNRVYINGRAAAYGDLYFTGEAIFAIESYGAMRHSIELQRDRANPYRSFGLVAVPKDHYLVLGDNRDNSADSRVRGFIPREEIVGRVRYVVLSLDPDRHLLPRLDRFFHAL
jgi:signal peptidase I